MAAELEAPIDKLTGVPYPLLPPETSVIDPNHPMFHSDEREFQTTGGRAVRQGRIQDVDIADHVVFHRRYDWIKTPKTPGEQFRYLGFIVAGEIPPYAIDVRRKSPWIRRLSEDETAQLRGGQIRIANNALLGKFFAEYAVEQDLSNSSAVDEFLNTTAIEGVLNSGDRPRRRNVANWMLKEALTQALEPMRDDYKKVKKRGSIALQNFDRLPHLMFSMTGPPHRENFMKQQWAKLTKESVQQRHVEALGEELEQAA